MAKYIVGSGVFDHPQLGTVNFAVRKQARKFIGRWKATGLHLTLPPFTTIVDLEHAIDSLLPRLLASKPTQTFYEIGQVMEFELFSVAIVGVKDYQMRCTLHRVATSRYEIRIDEAADLSQPEAIEAVAKMMKSIARYLAPTVLLPRAAIIADKIGRRPAEWRLTSGRKTLGRCDSRRVILLSTVLVFLPQVLRDYVVCHELAHLTEMNHSEKFHKLCDQYCGGKAAELERQLKAFRLPLP